MVFSVVARMVIWAILWYHVHLRHRSVILTAIAMKKAYSVLTSVDRRRTAHVVRRVREVDAERSVTRDRVLLGNYARTELAWQVVSEIRTVLEIDHASIENVWIPALEEKLVVRMPSARWLITKLSACVQMDSKVIHEKVACITNVKRTKTVNWIRSVS